MHSVLAFATAVGLVIAVADGVLWVALALFCAGLLPLAFALMRPAPDGAGALARLSAPRGGALALHIGSYLAQTGLLVALIALIPG
jgi:hypothetical protein